MKLEEFETLEKAATPRPWHNVYHNRTESNALTFFTEGCDLVNDMANVIAQAPDGSVARHDANFEFLAASREMVPKLIKLWRLANKWSKEDYILDNQASIDMFDLLEELKE